MSTNHMRDSDRPSQPTTVRFTDTENTGAPVVPIVDAEHIAAKDVETHGREEYEEAVLSHRLTGSN